MLQALIFDVDGTLADTESAHRAAFNQAFTEVGLNWHWNEALYSLLLSVSGGKERILHFWRMVAPEAANRASAEEIIAAIHSAKTRIYDSKVSAGQLALRPGVLRLMREALAHNVKLAIATTTTPANIDALLREPMGADWRRYFSAIGDASTAERKKPDPQVYRQVLDKLGMPADDCLAFEDSENGLRAACAAGLRTLVTPTAYTAMQSFDGALLVLPNLGDPERTLPQWISGMENRWVDLATLRNWHHGTLFEAA